MGGGRYIGLRLVVSKCGAGCPKAVFPWSQRWTGTAHAFPVFFSGRGDFTGRKGFKRRTKDKENTDIGREKGHEGGHDGQGPKPARHSWQSCGRTKTERWGKAIF